MFNHHFDSTTNKKVIFDWFVLCFNGGCINAGGFLSTGKFVSHVTGFATLFGVDLANSQFHSAISILSVPLFFLFGSFVAGSFIDVPILRKKPPRYDFVMLFCSLCLILISILSCYNFWGPFHNLYELNYKYFLLALLCLASGLQNGAISSSSRRSVRTTHLTGLVTDIGIGLARLFTFKSGLLDYNKEYRDNILRLGSFLSFVIGSGVGSYLFLSFGFSGFILPSLIALYAAWRGRNLKYC